MEIQYQNADDKHVVFALIFILSNQLQIIGDSFFKEVSTKQWFVLLVLDIMKGYSPTLNELSEQVGSSHQNVKQLILKLEQKGYVELTKDAEDARRLRIKVLQMRRLHRAYQEKSEIFMKQLFSSLDKEDLSVARNVMFAMRDMLERMKRIMSENKKVVVVYRSGTGFTKNYATWLSQELKCDLRLGKETKAADLLQYDTIIYGGGLYASGINGVKLITKNYDKLKGKKLLVFAVGASPVREETTAEIRKANIPADMFDKVQFFYLRGGFDYQRLSPFFKLLMNLKKLQLKSVKNPDADAKGFLASYSHPLDFTNIKNIKQILESVEV